ncbi:uncharacterized protein B0I36DRAFT_388639 [Microdochium trichocladiopsis]|uniref:NAD(P)-binding domain-containing protein n=1 Tax=Microdochium trichocladiopsis TaxID=1682393 RepID=A0A9P8XW53_9PEZI|nr:uncharacterized protein B0I36DRAFT_388639 [Microdochium trichocladiopsis]KAH7018426.1 hypothetical protein B0I36DRAFT_388639 [Microdochium trichocladiopsis]
MAPPHHHVLLIGGSGKIAKLLTPLLLQRSWTVTSMIRNPDQVGDLQRLGSGGAGGGNGKLNVLVRSVEDVKSVGDARSILDEVGADYVVWSAGAGGKGPPERTFTVDRDAASHFIRAAAASPAVTRFLMVSFITSRLAKPAWWSAETFDRAMADVKKALPRYYEAKVAADEVLYRESAASRGDGFAGICLRPGTLTDEPAGEVRLGKLPVASGNVSRESVARVAAELLAKDGVKSCWLDLLDGEDGAGEDISAAVDRCVRDGVDCAEGEPFAEV